MIITRTIKRNLKTLSEKDYVMVNGRVRSKARFEAYKMRRSILIGLIANGYIEPTDSVIKVTSKGKALLFPETKAKRQTAKERNKAYSDKKIANGYVRRSLWIHKDDITKFDDFVMLETRS